MSARIDLCVVEHRIRWKDRDTMSLMTSDVKTVQWALSSGAAMVVKTAEGSNWEVESSFRKIKK
jgi:hypothetical protein